jgi:hypothetical protein
MVAEVSLAEETPHIESLLADVQAAMSKRSGLKEYQVPEMSLDKDAADAVGIVWKTRKQAVDDVIDE